MERTQDRDYLARILWLIHDISDEFDMQFPVLEDWESWDPEEDVPYFEALARAFVGACRGHVGEWKPKALLP